MRDMISKISARAVNDWTWLDRNDTAFARSSFDSSARNFVSPSMWEVSAWTSLTQLFASAPTSTPCFTPWLIRIQTLEHAVKVYLAAPSQS